MRVNKEQVLPQADPVTAAQRNRETAQRERVHEEGIKTAEMETERKVQHAKERTDRMEISQKSHDEKRESVKMADKQQELRDLDKKQREDMQAERTAETKTTAKKPVGGLIDTSV